MQDFASYAVRSVFPWICGDSCTWYGLSTRPGKRGQRSGEDREGLPHFAREGWHTARSIPAAAFRAFPGCSVSLLIAVVRMDDVAYAEFHHEKQ